MNENYTTDELDAMPEGREVTDETGDHLTKRDATLRAIHEHLEGVCDV